MDNLKKLSDFLVARSFSAYNKKCGNCAKSVREAIEHAFSPKTLIRAISARKYGSSLEKFGFKKLEYTKDYMPKVGDVAIIDYEPNGHMCAYCSSMFPLTGKIFTGWVSDFQQRDIYGGKIREKSPKITIYRYE